MLALSLLCALFYQDGDLDEIEVSSTQRDASNREYTIVVFKGQ
jgi:hypothetical protein